MDDGEMVICGGEVGVPPSEVGVSGQFRSRRPLSARNDAGSTEEYLQYLQ